MVTKDIYSSVTGISVIYTIATFSEWAKQALVISGEAEVDYTARPGTYKLSTL